MYELFVDRPGNFAETQFNGMKLTRANMVAIRQAGNYPRIGMSRAKWSPIDQRRVEIVLALWRLCTRPESDVLVVVPSDIAWTDWLICLDTVLKQSCSLMLRGDIQIHNGVVLNRFAGMGQIRKFVHRGKELPLPLIHGPNPFAIITDFDSLRTPVLEGLLARCREPGLVMASTYA